MKCNGHRRVKVKTLHGQFEFELQKYLQAGTSVSYFELTGQMSEGYVSPRLQELSAYYSNRMSYQEVAKLVQRITGGRLLSDQTIGQIVARKAVEVSEGLKQRVETTLGETVKLPEVNRVVDIYHPNAAEVLLLEDGILVREQKEERIRRSTSQITLETDSMEAIKRPRVNTDVVMLQLPSGRFEYLSAPIAADASETARLARVVQARLIEEYGKASTALNIVVISDGAKAIGARVVEIFGTTVTTILDWYHLSRKLRALMSMIAQNKAEKSIHLRQLFGWLWRGQVQATLDYLHQQVQPKQADKLAELVGYLDKHRAAIIDYQRRQQVGKSIGSGRMEKGVDQVIGHRQKKKGTSWRPKGSKALAILKILELNGQWHQTWFPPQTT